MGRNELETKGDQQAFATFLKMFSNPLVLILLASAILSYFLGEVHGAVIIVVLVMLSASLQFFHEHQSNRAAAALRRQVAVHATVLRDGSFKEVLLAEVVPGDIVHLSAGDIIPGDARLISVNNLYVNQASVTGESFPVAKNDSIDSESAAQLTDMNYAVFMGCSVTSGIATAVVVSTGRNTEIGNIAHALTKKPPETEFQHGINEFSLMLTKVIVSLVLLIFLINALLKHNFFESFLFALAVSVGLTPELLPVIMTVTLAKGALTMSKKGVIVKRLESIQNFGSMDILCSDKTGTLTEGEFKLVESATADGAENPQILLFAWLNSTMQGGMKNPLDMTIAALAAPETALEYQKKAEIPFDFVRRMMSVVVEKSDTAEILMITKGAPESILKISTHFMTTDGPVELTGAKLAEVTNKFEDFSAKGYRVIAVACKKFQQQKNSYGLVDEQDVTLLGFLAFFDPPKASVRETILGLKALGVSLKILTGDNELVTRKVCEDIGIAAEPILTGNDIDTMPDEALSRKIDETPIFARLSPAQKNRIMDLLKRKGHVVGFIGDGINDAPSLHVADVGISVNNAVDVAKESASIILLEKSLDALRDGVVEGRRTFANTLKYIMMGTSSNFGNMFSMSIASVLVPFLPMAPVQILLNNLLYDFSQITIPSDNVDEEAVSKPRRWDIKFIRHFMLVFGPVSSLFDILTFALLLYFFRADEAAFQTGWFIESLATQVLVVHVIRSRYNILKSRSSSWLALSTVGVALLGFLIPYTPLGGYFGFTPLPAAFIGAICVLVISYLVLVDFAKRWFFARYGW
jgi:Mg2+-importing ATPase